MQPERVEGDVFDDDGEGTNAIVDCDVLEAAKENIQPLAGGRRATTLAAVLATPHGRRDARLAQTKARMRERVEEVRKRWEALIAQSKGGQVQGEEDEQTERIEDLEEVEELLLDSYARLVNWTIEHYPQGHSAESSILELIEEATRVLRMSQLAKGDARYLSLWIRYASYVEKPEVIYEYVLANEIGTEWAKLYEEYALVLERVGRRTKADEIYMLGIARRAQPLDHLERRHRDFQKRMMVATSVVDSSTTSGTITAPSSSSGSAAPRRRVLGEATSITSTTSLASSFSARRTGLAISSSSGSNDDIFSAPSALSSAAQNGRMAIFVDPTGEEAERASGNPWPELGTHKERIKENVRQPEKMNGTVLKQRGAAKAATKDAERRAKAAPKIVPFRDPEPAETSVSASSGAKGLPPKTPGNAAFKPFADEIHGDEQISGSNSSLAPKASGLTVPVTPRFIPFRDEASTQTPVGAPSQSFPVPDTIMRVKAVAGTSTAAPMSEAEALRKDPFKNYKDL